MTTKALRPGDLVCPSDGNVWAFNVPDPDLVDSRLSQHLARGQICLVLTVVPAKSSSLVVGPKAMGWVPTVLLVPASEEDG